MHLTISDEAGLQQAGDLLHDGSVDRDSVRFDAEAGEFTMRVGRDPHRAEGEKVGQYCWLTLWGVEEAQIKLDKDVPEMVMELRYRPESVSSRFRC